MAKKESDKPSRSRGLGDTIKKFTDATGLTKAAKLWEELTGQDCGCDARQEKLNQMFPYKVECLEQDEYDFIQEIKDKNTIKAHEQYRINEIYQRVFNKRVKGTSCGRCVRDRIKQLEAVANTYEA